MKKLLEKYLKLWTNLMNKVKDKVNLKKKRLNKKVIETLDIIVGAKEGKNKKGNKNDKGTT